MGRIASLTSLLALCLLADCTRYPLPAQFLAKRGIAPPEETRVAVCHGFACTFLTEVAFSRDEWAKVAALFYPPAADPAGERRQIGRAVALFERFVGSKIGTDSDIGGLTYIAAGNPTQLDCIDETTNTTTYLTLLQSRGLLRWHRTGQPAARGFFLDGRWHHETAVLVEQAGNAEFAIDSWVEDNGKPPLIVPLEQWQWTWGAAK